MAMDCSGRTEDRTDNKLNQTTANSDAMKIYYTILYCRGHRRRGQSADHRSTPYSQSTIAAALTPVPPRDPPVERSSPPADLDEEPAENEEKLKALLAQGCGCKRAGGKPCSTLFTEVHFVDILLQCADLTRQELNLVLLGQIMATLSDGPYTADAKHRHPATDRKLTSMAFYHAGQCICGRTFQWLHGIGMLPLSMWSYISVHRKQ